MKAFLCACFDIDMWIDTTLATEPQFRQSIEQISAYPRALDHCCVVLTGQVITALVGDLAD